MIAILVIIVIILATVAFTIFGLRYALAGKRQQIVLPPHGARGLFSDPASEGYADNGTDKKSISDSNRGVELIERARRGDLAALSDAHATGSIALYDEALDALIEQASGRHELLSALVSHIAKSKELRANAELADRVLSSWKAQPDRRSTIEMLHIAALSGDASMYQKAVEEVTGYWHGGRLTGISAEELIALIESEYWVLASETRLGGAGFALKRSLADVRRKLAAATPAR